MDRIVSQHNSIINNKDHLTLSNERKTETGGDRIKMLEKEKAEGKKQNE
jgi:hypothetical protein